MDAARQVIRWSIPGTMLLLSFGAYQLLLLWTWGYSTGDLLAHPTAQRIGLAKALVAVASGVPLGFMVYQWYYALYGRMLRSVVYRDRGTEILRYLPADRREQLARVVGMEGPDVEVLATRRKFLLRLDCAKHERKAMRHRYRKRELANWALVRSCIDAPDGAQGLAELKCEYTMLSDIYHSVGATRIAIVAAYVLSCTYTVVFHWQRVNEDTLATSVGFLLGVAVLCILVYPLAVARRNSMESLLATLKNGLYRLTGPTPSRGWRRFRGSRSTG